VYGCHLVRGVGRVGGSGGVAVGRWNLVGAAELNDGASVAYDYECWIHL
jgi:hypothetical protein